MFTPLTIAVAALSVLTLLLACVYAWRKRLIDDALLGGLALLEVALIVQAIVALAHVSGLSQEKATFVAYALTLPFVPPGVAFLAIKEKTRWAMATIAVGAFAVGVMTGRLDQIWGLHA